MRRALKRVLRIASCFLAAIVALSICLRVSSAWQVPQAKRVLSAVSRLRTGQSADKAFYRLLSRYGFQKRNNCDGFHCSFELGIGQSYPYIYAVLSEQNAKRASWVIQNIAVPLGYRPWNLNVNIDIQQDKILDLNYSLMVLDQTGYGVQARFRGNSKLEIPDEDNPNLAIYEYPRWGEKVVAIAFTPLSKDVEYASQPDFSCVWNVIPCSTGYDVFPRLRKLQAKSAAARAERLSSSNPCPTSNMFSRARDSEIVWLGIVTGESTLNELPVSLTKLLKNGRIPMRFDNPETVHLPATVDEVFPRGLHKGDRVIVTNSDDCSLLPATQENLAELDRSLSAYPSHQPDMLPGIEEPAPVVRAPEGLQ